jgi:hypothetical protein
MVTSKNIPSARPANQIQRISLNLTTGSGAMGQLGFFDLSRRYEGLDAKDDPLVAIAAMIPWESLRPKLKASLITGGLRASDVARKSPAGLKPWDEVVIFKALVLRAGHHCVIAYLLFDPRAAARPHRI